MARFADDRALAAEYCRLGDLYIRLAEQAEQNSKLDVAVEIGPPLRSGDKNPPR